MNYICPDCAESLSGDHADVCPRCDWRMETSDGVKIFVGEQDRSDPVLKEYFSNYDSISEEDLRKGILEQRYVERQAKRLVEYAGEIRGLVICDLGCGQGLLTRMLRERGAQTVVATDISLAYLSRLTEINGVVPVLANAENLPVFESFDLVVCTDVMEHVLNLGSFLFCLNRALKPGGRTVIRVPYRESLLNYSRHLGCPYRFVHLRSFDKITLIDSLETAGFEIRAVKYDGRIAGRPHAFWNRGEIRRLLYARFQDWANVAHDAPSNGRRLPDFLASLFMPPLEIVVIAKKSRSFEQREDGAWQLN